MPILSKSSFVPLLIVAIMILGCEKRGDTFVTDPFRQTSRYEIKGGLAIDKKTGLTWQRCSIGKRWVDQDRKCVGEIKLLTYAEAKQQEDENWRMPTSDELLTLRVEPRASFDPEPFIDTTAFPDFDYGNWWYWSGTRSQHISKGAWAITFGKATYAGASNYDLGLQGAVRLVLRSKPIQKLNSTAKPATNEPMDSGDETSIRRFVIRDGLAYDNATDLIWQRCSVGKHWDEKNGRCLGYVKLMPFQEAQEQGDKIWRVPTPDELVTLFDQNRVAQHSVPTINLKIFPDITFEDWWYWTNKSVFFDNWPGVRNGWVVSFLGEAGTQADVDASPLAVRLVRNRLLNEEPWEAAASPKQGKLRDNIYPGTHGKANARYVISGSEVFDKEANLTWQRCSVGRHWINDARGCVGVLKLLTFEEAQHESYETWHVPSKAELATLIDKARKTAGMDSTIDVTAFPEFDAATWWYWTSTTDTATGAYSVNFGKGVTPDFDGVSGNTTRGARQPVRLVRNGK